jgi:hypothetical protein
MKPSVRAVEPGSFEPERHFYPRVLNAQIHPMVRSFMSLSTTQVVKRYRHLNPAASEQVLTDLLTTPTKRFRWSGGDLMPVTTTDGRRRMVIIETNSSPSGQKSMPLFDDLDEHGGYRTLLEHAVLPRLKGRLPTGGLAVLYDKNEMEASGYAATLADLTGERVWLTRFDQHDPEPPARFTADGVLHIRDPQGEWRPIRAGMRYVTQRPWNRIPIEAKTMLVNPIAACLAGGRNKMLASTAYDLFNGELTDTGLRVETPVTIRDVAQREVPVWVESMGGRAVVKVPYSNAGQGVYTITTEAELAAFMATEQPYDRFIVQALIGNHGWSSQTSRGVLYHVGTMPDRRGNIHVADLRMMVAAGPTGFRPVALYARRARAPLAEALTEGVNSWDMLGTNLSYKNDDGSFGTDPSRLLLMDQRDFNRVGVGLDGLIEAYVQTVLATVAIDRLAHRLHTQRGRFRRRLFGSMNADDALIGELLP